MTKSELRKIYLAKQKSLSPEERFERSRKISIRLFQNFDTSKIKFLHCFLPIKKFNEIDTKIIFEKLRKDFPRVGMLVPRINFQTSEIENLKLTPETELKQNQWKIHEPTHDETIETEKIDVVLVPLLCFDRRGFRVGYGKGFYDRFLSKCRVDCLKIGLSYFAPIADISNVENFDMKLDFCVTPEEVFHHRGTQNTEFLRKV